MAKRWSEIDSESKRLIRQMLLEPRQNARREAAEAIQSGHARACKQHTHDEHVLMALKIAERAEDAIDAALERLGL